MDYFTESLKKHAKWKGKIEIVCRAPLKTIDDLSIAYTPGVAAPCLEIQKNVQKSYEYTRRGNTVAVVTDGTAVLGLGDIGPEAGMPVMEGKCALFKVFGDVDALPICIRSKDADVIVETVAMIAGSFGGINLEDISAPRCFEIERRLKERCDIPVFHDDQHGTAIVTGAALLNALKLTGKRLDKAEIVINGAGSAGIAIAKFLTDLGAKHITMVDRFGIICEGMDLPNAAHAEIALTTNRQKRRGTLADAMRGADVFVGVSAPNCVTADMVRSMADKSILFPMANPDPEIMPDLAFEAGAFIVGTGRSDFPNQINNVLVFPGVFRGALDACARDITCEMQIAAAHAIADYVPKKKLSTDYIIPSVFDKGVATAVAAAVAAAWRDK
jgi:malate dehydrogenase (oxaloacetate-decarboxylating)